MLFYHQSAYTISIHAPRVRCDHLFYHHLPCNIDISIHAPRVRCDLKNGQMKALTQNFNPRTSCEVRRKIFLCFFHSFIISIHAPRVRCDPAPWFRYSRLLRYFNPRTSCEVRRKFPEDLNGLAWISIHAPRVRCDSTYHKVHFYQVCLHVFREP